MKVYEFDNYNELRSSKVNYEENILIYHAFPYICVSLNTECKKPKTAVKRLARALIKDERFEKYIPIIEDKIFSGEYYFDDGNFSFFLSKLPDGSFSIMLNV